MFQTVRNDRKSVSANNIKSLRKTKWKSLLLFIMALSIVCVSDCMLCFAVAENSKTILYAIPSVANPYEQTFNTFTFNNCLPAQWMNQSPVVTDYEEDPNGLTWCLFAFEHGVVQLTGKDYEGKWKKAIWSNVDSEQMLFICYCLCKAFGSVYSDNKDFAICLYFDSGDHSYILNKTAADSFIQMIDNEYGEKE